MGRDEIRSGANCWKCGKPVLPIERQAMDEKGHLWCSGCLARLEKRQGRSRNIQRHFHWAHGHDPSDPDADKNSPWEYINLDIVETGDPDPNQRHLLKGGPETPFPCGKCGALLRAAASATVSEVLEPIGYKPPKGALPPNEKIVALACPNDRPDNPHPVVQFRESFLKLAMANWRRTSHD